MSRIWPTQKCMQSLMRGAIHLTLSLLSHALAEPSAEFRLSQIELLASGDISLKWKGYPGHAYQVESSDLRSTSWTKVGEPVLVADHARELQYTENAPQQSLKKFYRIRRKSILDQYVEALSNGGKILDADTYQALDQFLYAIAETPLLAGNSDIWLLGNKWNTTTGPIYSLRGRQSNAMVNVTQSDYWCNFQQNGHIAIPNPHPGVDQTTHHGFAVFRSQKDWNWSVVYGGGLSGSHSPTFTVAGAFYAGQMPTELGASLSYDGISTAARWEVPGRRTWSRVFRKNHWMTAFWSHDTLTDQQVMTGEAREAYSAPVNNTKFWNNTTTWFIGGRGDQSSLYAFEGQISLVAVGDSALTKNEFHTVRQAYLKYLSPKINTWQDEPLVIVEGDSMSEVNGTSSPWMIQLMGYPNWNDVKWRNVAKGGETITQQLNGFDRDVLPVLREPRCNRIYFFHWEKGRVGTYEENHASLRSIWSKARSKGAIVVAFTDTPTVSGGMPTVRNELIRNDLGVHYDILVDLATIPDLQNPADTTYYHTDGVHLDTHGYAKVAELINLTIPAP